MVKPLKSVLLAHNPFHGGLNVLVVASFHYFSIIKQTITVVILSCNEAKVKLRGLAMIIFHDENVLNKSSNKLTFFSFYHHGMMT